MIPSTIDKGIIDVLIWGYIESEFIEEKFPLSISDEVRRMTKDLVWQLFVGFLYFVHYKCDLVPKLRGCEKTEFDSVGGVFEDRSAWIDLLNCVEPIRGPYSFKQFADKNDDEYTICIILDTFSLFECGKILNETELKGESKFSFSEVSKEFNIMGKGLSHMLAYFKSLNDAKWVCAHTLVLRPSKLAEYLFRLDDELEYLQDYPERIVRKEEWENMTTIDHLRYLGISNKRINGCNEENFRELLKEHSIEIPGVKFLTFYEYMQDKLDPRIKKEWEDIRDRYTDRVKKLLEWAIPALEKDDFRPAKGYLANASEYLEAARYTESVIQTSKALEETLYVLAGRTRVPGDTSKGMKIVMKKYERLKKHETNLNFIRAIRNKLVHPSGMDECDERVAKFALEAMNQFLMDVKNRFLVKN